MLTLVSCDKDNMEEDCVCFLSYDPVCGDDGQEYSNSCFAECAGVTYSSGTCPQTTQARVLDLGDPALDGCGWVLEFEVNNNNQFHRPDTLAEAYKINELSIELTYQTTLDSSICGLLEKIPVIRVVQIIE